MTKGTGSENRMQSEQQKQVQCQLGGGAQPSYQSLEFHLSEDSEDRDEQECWSPFTVTGIWLRKSCRDCYNVA